MAVQQKQVDDFVRRFEFLTDQLLEDWSSYQELELHNEQGNPLALLKCLDNAICGELDRVLDEQPSGSQATYVRDLAQLLVDVRSKML